MGACVAAGERVPILIYPVFTYFRGDQGRCCAGFREDPDVTRVLRHGTRHVAPRVLFLLSVSGGLFFFLYARPLAGDPQQTVLQARENTPVDSKNVHATTQF